MLRNCITHGGFTRTSLLVAMAFVVVVAGLVLPAVQKSRATAARAACQRNLQLIGAAMSKYESDHGCFPYTLSLPPNQRLGRGWMPLILPYVNQDKLARQFQYDLDWSEPSNAVAIKTEVPAFICPSAKGGERLLTKQMFGAELWPYPDAATTDYLGIQGILMTLKGTEWVPPGVEPIGCGAIGRDAGWRLADFADGTAQTLAVSEDAGRPYIWRVGKRSPSDHNPTILPERPNLSGAWAAQNVTGYRSFSTDGMQVPGVCPINCSNWIGGLYSFHDGGAHGLFVDGSIRFLSQSTSVHVVYALVTRSGGEALSASDY